MMKLVTTDYSKFVTDASDKTLMEWAAAYVRKEKERGRPLAACTYTWVRIRFVGHAAKNVR